MPERKPTPILSVLSYSGGRQSKALLRMTIDGTIKRPKNFVVLNVDPGMENSGTYPHVAEDADLCEQHGIDFMTVRSGDLFRDLVWRKERGLTRIDNPPYWTKQPDGKRGKLKQSCTKFYKIAPIWRATRRILELKFGISANPNATSHLWKNMVDHWIGFAADEEHRSTESPAKYVRFRYPLIENNISTDDIMGYFRDNSISPPPRSMCNACFAHGLRSLKEMHDNRPDDWEQAVLVDESIRDMSDVKVKLPCYVSATLIPLTELAERDFDLGNLKDNEVHSCNTGMCFV